MTKNVIEENKSLVHLSVSQRESMQKQAKIQSIRRDTVISIQKYILHWMSFRVLVAFSL